MLRQRGPLRSRNRGPVRSGFKGSVPAVLGQLGVSPASDQTTSEQVCRRSLVAFRRQSTSGSTGSTPGGVEEVSEPCPNSTTAGAHHSVQPVPRASVEEVGRHQGGHQEDPGRQVGVGAGTRRWRTSSAAAPGRGFERTIRESTTVSCDRGRTGFTAQQYFEASSSGTFPTSLQDLESWMSLREAELRQALDGGGDARFSKG